MSQTETPSVAGSLIAELEQGGELVDVGKFSVDASQALVKLRDHQLVDRQEWVLLAIEAAVLAGATRVSVRPEGEGDLVFELPLDLAADELEQLFAWVFVELDDVDTGERRRRRALQQLALASNAALGLELRELVIESGGTRLRMTPEKPLGVLESAEEATPGTRLRTVGARMVGRTRQIELIHERCRYTTHDIRIGDVRISRGPNGAIVDAEFERMGVASARTKPLIDAQGRTIGRHGRTYRVDAGKPSLWIVSNGVLIERIELDELDHDAAALEPNFVAVVELDLPRDLSQAKVRRGPELDAILQVARAAATKVGRKGSGHQANLELVTDNDGIGLRVLYGVLALIGGTGGLIAFGILLADHPPPGTFAWFLGLSASGIAGLAMLRRSAQ